MFSYIERGSAITKVEVSNDPNFNEGTVTELSGQKYRLNKDTDDYSCYKSYSQSVLPSEIGKYRYVRITGEGSSNGWQLNEVEIYTNKEAAASGNVAANADAYWMPISGGGSTYESFVPENATDGDDSTVAISFSGFLVVELPYPVKVKQIDISSWNSPYHTNNKENTAGFNVWLSNANDTISGALNVSSAQEGR